MTATIRWQTALGVACITGAMLTAQAALDAQDVLQEAPEIREVKASETAGLFTIAGLPQHSYSFDVEYEHGEITPLRTLGTVGFVIRPKGPVHPERRWLWVSNLFLAVQWNDGGGVVHRFIVERALERGFHVVGVDVGTSLGSPAGAELYDRFHALVVNKYHLNQRACMLGHSNGGLITLGFAFRHPDKVERILGIFPATDFRSWPGFDRVTGDGRITPAGLSYELDPETLRARINEFNPIDNLEPLAKAKVPIYHIHGTADDVVPLEANSQELVRRYRALGGQMELEIIEGGKHGGPEFYSSQAAANFIVE
jgi:pimeloyl-ACP methyl ester carboxylesterase